MLKIRLQRVGKKGDFSFRMVLTDSRNSTKSGRFLEILGTYNPKLKTFAAKADRVRHWLSKGVQLTPTLHNLLITHKIIDGKKINVLPKKTVPAKPASEATPATESAAPAEEATAPETADSTASSEAAPASTEA